MDMTVISVDRAGDFEYRTLYMADEGGYVWMENGRTLDEQITWPSPDGDGASTVRAVPDGFESVIKSWLRAHGERLVAMYNATKGLDVNLLIRRIRELGLAPTRCAVDMHDWVLTHSDGRQSGRLDYWRAIQAMEVEIATIACGIVCPDESDDSVMDSVHKASQQFSTQASVTASALLWSGINVGAFK